MVKCATSLFNSFCSNVAKQVDVFVVARFTIPYLKIALGRYSPVLIAHCTSPFDCGKQRLLVVGLFSNFKYGLLF